MVDTFLDGHDELYHHVKLQVKLRRTDGHLVRLAVQNFTSIGAAGCECGPKISKISTFGKESPHRGDSLDRFRNFIGAFLWARRALSPCKVWGRSHNVRKCGVCFLVFLCHAPSSEHRAFEGRIVRNHIALPSIARFRRDFHRFSERIAL